MVSFSPARTIGLSNRAITGTVVLANGRAASFESSLERDWLIVLDFDPRVRGLYEQPFTLHYDLRDTRRRYTPDLRADFVDRGRSWTVVYEVKYRDELRATWALYRARFGATAAYCRERGWRFRVVTERSIRTPRMKTATFLRRYRTVEPQPIIGEALLSALVAAGTSTPNALLDAVEADRGIDRQSALTELWRLMATHHVITRLAEPLTMVSPLWVARSSHHAC